MIAGFDCDTVLLVQAELDGELDAAAAAALAVHRAGCPICQAASAGLAEARQLVADERESGLYHRAPDDFRQRLAAQLDAGREQAPTPPHRRRARGWAAFRPERWRPGVFGFGLGAACAATLAFLVVTPHGPDITGEIVAGHIRALQPGHLEDVVSTDQHTVKPWFDGRIDFAPPVKDLAAQRFPLKGGRLDYIGGRPVAALVYQRDKHLIDLFAWPAAGDSAVPPAISTQHGYNVVHWVENGMALWAVSDVEAGQLREFAEDWRQSP